MPLPGGATDKIGNRYEARWTVYCMIDVMTEKADFIQIEKAGEDAFEFLLDRQACLISLVMEEANWLAKSCLSGTEIHRSAAAEIFVANLRKAHLQEFCEKSLIQLFHDENEEVRSSAARCFWKIKDNEIENHFSLIEEFVASPAFFKNSEPLILLLEKATTQLPEKTTYEICERLLEDVHSGSANADSVNRVLVKLYNQSKDQQLQSSCLDLIDLMAQKQMIGLTEVLTQYER